MNDETSAQFEYDMAQFEQAGKKGKSTFTLACGIIAAAFLCLGLVIAAVVGAMLFGFNSMKSTAVYQQAVTIAQNNPKVINALGEPIETGFFLSGSINVNSEGGNADIAIPLSGPKGKGTLYLQATRTAGNWDFYLLEVEVEGSSGRINLLAETGR